MYAACGQNLVMYRLHRRGDHYSLRGNAETRSAEGHGAGFEEEDAWGAVEGDRKGGRKRTRDETCSFLAPPAGAGEVNHRWIREQGVSLQRSWPMSLCFKRFSVGSRCDAIFAVLGHRDHGLTRAISQSSEPIQDMLKRHWCAWHTSGRRRAKGVSVYSP